MEAYHTLVNDSTMLTPWDTSQPTLTELVRLGMGGNEEPDYITDPVFTRCTPEMYPGWPTPPMVYPTKPDTNFLEQHDVVPHSSHPFPAETLAYLAEDDNSYLKLEQDLTNDTPVDVIGGGVYPSPETFRSAASSNISFVGPLFGGPNANTPLPRTTPNNLNSLSLSCSRPTSSLFLHRDPNEIDITGGQRNVMSHPLTEQHRFSLQKLLGFGSYHDQQNLRALAANHRPIGKCIPNFAPQPSTSFQRFRQARKPSLTSSCAKNGNTKRKYERRTSKEDQINKGNNLWQFIMRLLGSRTDIAAWTGNDLEFKIVNKEEIARQWGVCKKREKMNFDKFSRALRYYYNKRILIHNPQCRLTYCFMRNPGDQVFCEMLETAMRTLPNLHVCNARCDNSEHPHETQYDKRKIRSRKNLYIGNIQSNQNSAF